MAEAVRRHRELERKLRHVRWLNQGLESEEEERLLDEMEAVWWGLSEQERTEVDRDDPATLIRPVPVYAGCHRLEDGDVWVSEQAPTHALKEVS